MHLNKLLSQILYNDKASEYSHRSNPKAGFEKQAFVASGQEKQHDPALITGSSSIEKSGACKSMKGDGDVTRKN